MGVYKYTLPELKRDGVTTRPSIVKYRVCCHVKNAKGEVVNISKRGFDGKKEAMRYEQQARLEVMQQSPEYMNGVLDAYLKDRKARCKPTTFSMQQYFVENIIRPRFGAMKISAITPTTIREWQTEMLNSDKHYSATYLRALNAKFSAIMNFAVRYYGLKQNPVPLAGQMGKKNRDTITFWTVDEFKKFIYTFKDETFMDSRSAPAWIYDTVFTLLFFSGIREGEMLALTPADIDFENNSISITKNYAFLGGKELIMAPKTPKSTRTVTLPSFVMEKLAKLLKTLPSVGKNQRIFTMVNKTVLNRVLKTHAKIAGVKQIRVHDLRHSCASNLAFAGVSFQVIQERLGHERLTTTLETYTHLIKNKKDVAVDAFDKMMKSKKG